VIILVGPDGCGKSTVAEELRKLLPGWSYRHHDRPAVDPYTFYSPFIAYANPRVIVDRFYLCNRVYGPTYQNQPIIGDHQWRILELMSLSRLAQVIYLTDSVEAIKSRWDGDKRFDPEKMGQIKSLYDDQFENGGTTLPRVRGTLMDFVPCGELLVKICAAEKQNAQFADRLLQPSLGCGRPKCNGFMIVGEGLSEYQINKNPQVQAPFCGGPASELLWDAIDEGDIRWDQGYYTNAADFSTAAEFTHYVGDLIQPTTLITIGNRADNLVSKSVLDKEMNVVRMRHPMYVRRFEHSKMGEWKRSLQEVLTPWRR
jgi:hypothetical protein